MLGAHDNEQAQVELPDLYGKDMLHLMSRDANSLYCYWEVSNRRKWLVAQHFECDWGDMPKVLRIYDVTNVYFNGHNANSYRDVEVTADADNWYIHGVRPGAVHLVDFGVYSIRRQFIPILRSNAVSSARDATASWGEPLVATVPEARINEPGDRIPPRSFENFAPYAIYNQSIQMLTLGGDHTNEKQLEGPTAPEGLPGVSPARPSALYPPS